MPNPTCTFLLIISSSESEWFSDLTLHSVQYTVCVCVFSSHSFWTSSSLDVPAGVTQDFSSTFFLRCGSLTIQSFSATRWAFLVLVFSFFSEKNPVCRDRTHVPTCQRLHGTAELPGRPAHLVTVLYYTTSILLLLEIDQGWLVRARWLLISAVH